MIKDHQREDDTIHGSTKPALSSEHDTAFQKMMLEMTSPVADDEVEDHDAKSHVLISNTGQDYFDNGHSIRNKAFHDMMKHMHASGSEDGDDHDPDAQQKKTERQIAAIWQNNLAESIRTMLEELGLVGSSSYRYYSAKDLEAKGEVSADDIARADISDARTASLIVLRVRGNNDDDNDRFFIGDGAIAKFLTAEGGKVDPSRMESYDVATAQSKMIDRNLSKYEGMVDYSGPVGLTPSLVALIQKDSKVASYVAIAQEAARKEGLDPNMFPNQLWRESSFNPLAKSDKGARGIAQMMPDKLGKYGLETQADFNDPIKSIRAAAQMMGQLTRKYGDQRLALVAYNGGQGSLNFAAEKLGVEAKDLTFKQWYQFNVDRAARLGTQVKSAWHVETSRYLKDIYVNNLTTVGKDLTNPAAALAEAPKPSS
ncbi:MAG TPA: transglycosylase SLT domain-containing protein, partial [Alphaproteobacteria bacterium]|nr:transglycosylase SLT domain-containing protein [Alphaproteobacteria bacterium]